MENTERIRVELKNRLAHITLSQPPENYLTHQLMGEAGEALDWIGSQRDLAAVLVSSAGGHFSLGFDYSEHAREMVFSILERYRTMCHDLINLDCPCIALVDGKVKNAACDLLYFFDVVLATANSTFQYDQLKTGQYPLFGPIFLPERLGFAKASRLLLEEPVLTAGQAQEAGLVSHICSREEIVPELKKIIALVSSHSVPVLSLCLKHLRRRKLDLVQTQVEEPVNDYLNVLTDLEDYGEGVQAWREKRAPVWRNR